MKYSKTLSQEAAADQAGMSLRTARDYLKSGGQMGEAKEWKYRLTHKDIFADVLPKIEGMLTINPGLQAQTLMQWLIDQYPDQFNWSHRRTLERRISKWRALKGPGQEVMFPQKHIPGKQSQSDWTHCTELGVMVDGQSFPHMLFHFMLPYSRWETACISHSESFDSLTMGYVKSVAASVPLSCGEIIQKALDMGKLQGTKKEWEPTVQAKLFYEVTKAKNSSISRPTTGRFALKSSPPGASQMATKTSVDSEDVAKLKEENRALKEENAALKSLVKRYMT